MASRKNLIPRDVRRLVERLRLHGPAFYAGTLNGEPNGYRAVRVPPIDRREPTGDGGGEPSSSDPITPQVSDPITPQVSDPITPQVPTPTREPTRN